MRAFSKLLNTSSDGQNTKFFDNLLLLKLVSKLLFITMLTYLWKFINMTVFILCQKIKMS